MRNVKPTYNEKDLGVNPCANSLVIPVNTIIFEKSYKIAPDGTAIDNIGDVEATPYTKLYISAERRILINGLSSRAKELFLWLMYEMSAGQDHLWINKQRYMYENGITSVNTYKEAVKELVRYGFLAISVVSDVYWINPDFFFRGNRVKKYPNKILKKDVTGDNA